MKKKTIIFFLILTFIFFYSLKENHTTSNSSIYLLQLNGIINPITSQYVVGGIEDAEAEEAECLILQLDTPGGLDTSMRDIIRKMLNSTIPIVVYVSPSGGRAASAGVFITLASNIAAMAPGTNIGAAHPVVMGEGEIDEEMKAKLENDAAAYIKTIAEKRGRNARWAEKAVRESVSITEQEAIEIGVIEFIANDVDELIEIIDGVRVTTASKTRVLKTKDAEIIPVKMTFKDLFLHSLTNPNIAYILLFLGIYGILGEFSNPGSFFPGIVGGISLILAFVAFQSIPINYGGFILITFGVVLFILEIYTPTFGVLTAGGVTSLILGSFMLSKSSAPFLRISLGLIISMSLATAAFFVFALSKGIKIQWKKPVTGREGLLGKMGITKTDLTPEGTIFVHGERWQASTKGEKIKEGEEVEVLEVKGLNLIVKKYERKE
ncbi:MAG: nodulation protein NfeD [Candidatus Caldatribacteriota bacterium]|nr:nodulation protein NfeD [Candidatus Caldatribacteriota bacterium]